MKKVLKATSSHFLSQPIWRNLRKILSRNLWTSFYRLSQKSKMKKLLSKFLENNYLLKNNLKYSSFNGDISSTKKFSYYLKIYNSSKPHGEYRHYLDEIFQDIKLTVKTILELGVSEGAGVRSLKDYFCNSYIWGIDIDKETFFEDKRVVKMEVADQLKLNTLKTSGEKFNTKFDLIIDDGWHHPESQIKSLIAFLPYLNQGGLYIVEDIVHEQYYEFFIPIIDHLEKNSFKVKYKSFDVTGSDISNNLGYLFIRRN